MFCVLVTCPGNHVVNTADTRAPGVPAVVDIMSLTAQDTWQQSSSKVWLARKGGRQSRLMGSTKWALVVPAHRSRTASTTQPGSLSRPPPCISTTTMRLVVRATRSCAEWNVGELAAGVGLKLRGCRTLLTRKPAHQPA